MENEDNDVTIIEQCKALCQVYKRKDHQSSVKIARHLMPILSEAYSAKPELFGDRNVNEAQSIIRRYIRANYIKPPKGLKIYRGGAPGLGN